MTSTKTKLRELRAALLQTSTTPDPTPPYCPGMQRRALALVERFPRVLRSLGGEQPLVRRLEVGVALQHAERDTAAAHGDAVCSGVALLRARERRES